MIFERDGTVATAVARHANATTVALVADTAFLGSGAVIWTDFYVAVDTDVTGFAETVAVVALAVSRAVVARHYHVARIKTLHFIQLLVMHR